jgi:hypothetical protein
MVGLKRLLYGPALRMKAGELNGLAQLMPDIKDCVLPRLIIPPRAERDDELQATLMDVESAPGAGIVVGRCWPDRSALLDAEHLFDDFGDDRATTWLPRMFRLARRSYVDAIPVARLADLVGPRRLAFRASIERGTPIELALLVTSGEMLDDGINQTIQAALEGISVSAERCVLLSDFTDADISDADVVAGVMKGAFDQLEAIGRWVAIVSQATSYPEVNPAEHGGNFVVPRKEWSAWKRAVDFTANSPDHLVFGDFAADHAKLDFGANGGRAIRHYRYTTKSDWLVVRAAEKGKDSDLMRDVCKRILRSGLFAGRAFSMADDYIYRTAHGLDGPGNSTNWREKNTTHHITRVVREVGATKGLTFSDVRFEEAAPQGNLFDDDNT